MKSQNTMLLSAKFVAKDVVGNVLFWPVWWYSVGFWGFLKKRRDSIRNFEEEIGLTIWVVNWGKPMFGQYDVPGRIISFVFRTGGIIFKAVQLIVYLIIQMLLIVGWLVLPPFFVWQFLAVIF